MMGGLTSLLRRIDKCTESLATLRVLPQQSVVLSQILISYTPRIALTCTTTSRSIPRRTKRDTFNFRLCIPLLWYHTKPGWVALHETVLLIRPVSTMFSKFTGQQSDVVLDSVLAPHQNELWETLRLALALM